MNLQKIPVLNTISFKNSYGFSLFGFAGFIAKSYADTQCFISHFLRHPVEWNLIQQTTTAASIQKAEPEM